MKKDVSHKSPLISLTIQSILLLLFPLGGGLVLQLQQGDRLWVRTNSYKSRFDWKNNWAFGCTFTGFLIK